MDRLDIPGPPNSTLFMIVQLSMLLLIGTTAFVMSYLLIGGFLGFAVAMVVALMCFKILRLFMFKFVTFWYFSRKGQPIDSEVVAIADYAFETQDWNGAVRRLEDLILFKGDSVQRLMSLGGMQVECGEYQRALASFDRALEMDSKMFQMAIRSGQADALRRLGRAGESYDIICAILDVGWKASDVYCVGSQALADLGRFEKAEEFLKMANTCLRTMLSNSKMSKPLISQLKRELEEAHSHLDELKKQSI